MANEIQVTNQSGKTIYFIVVNRTGQFWNTNTAAFESYNAANWANYAVATTEQGASAIYLGTFPVAIAAGVYGVVGKQQLGGSAAVTDPTIGTQDYQWNGSATLPLADLVTSGLLGQIPLVRLTRGVMVQNFPIYFKSSADHITPFTSGVVSGQIARDNGAFVVLQSGAFTEAGQGFFNLQSLTSGDLLCNTAKLLFSANGISGGSADPVPLGLVLQRSSGQ